MSNAVSGVLFSIVVMNATATVVWAQYSQTPAQDQSSLRGQDAPQTQPADQVPRQRPGNRVSDSDQIEQQLLNELKSNPMSPRNTDKSNGSDSPAGVGATQIDHGILGTAPGDTPPKLRREGEFIVNRRGRVMQSPNGRHLLFIFESDSTVAQEAPMILSPCQMLQNIEDIIRERGDNVVFILSGQVLVYHGYNYMLPTMMKLAIDHGNLEN